MEIERFIVLDVSERLGTEINAQQQKRPRGVRTLSLKKLKSLSDEVVVLSEGGRETETCTLRFLYLSSF